MASVRMRAASAVVALLFRRRSWGAHERAVARRARRLFGAPRWQQWLAARGLAVQPVAASGVRGEWLIPPAPRGVVFYIHGGGYAACTPQGHRPITAGLARRGPFRVFAPDYRLAPEHRYPAALDDVEASYRWLLEQQADPRTVAVVGDSAGGGLVLSLLARLRDSGAPLPACAACLSPWTDLTGSGASVRGNDGRCAMFRPENMDEFAAIYLAGHAATDPAASPLFACMSGLPPILLQVGTGELLLDDARRTHDAIRAAGGESELQLYEGCFHGWHICDGVIPESTAALDSVAEFVRKHTAVG